MIATALELIASGYARLLVLVVGLLALLWALREPVKQPMSPGNSQSVDDVPAIVSRLRQYANGLVRVNVDLYSNAHRLMADRIASAFELAGWELNYGKVAQEPYNPHYMSGIEVRGFNAQLVNVAALAVTDLGGWDVRTSVEELKLKRDNPKWARGQQTIYITIGYPKS